MSAISGCSSLRSRSLGRASTAQTSIPSILDKAAALGFSLVSNHPFVDGNKRVGHAALEVFLMLNGYELEASVDEQERIILAVAAGDMSREEFSAWVNRYAVEIAADRRT